MGGWKDQLAHAQDYADTIKAPCTFTGLFQWSTALDNHESTRAFAGGVGVAYLNAQGDPSFIIWPDTDIREPDRALYLMDDGTTVQPMYVAGWSHDAGKFYGHVIIQPFPVNVNGDGTPKLRADRPTQVDYSGWMLGPRRAYHVKWAPVPADITSG